MDKSSLIGKGLTVGIIFLFIGVAFAPIINFNSVKASNDTDLVEVTIQACGIKGYGDTIVNLTREQYQNLEQYLDEFRARFNQTSTSDEAIPLFKEAVVELNKYGLLPKGMRVEETQMLVVGNYLNLQRFSEYLNCQTQSDDENLFCLVAGSTTVTYVSRFPLCSILSMILYLKGEYGPLYSLFSLRFFIRNSLPFQIGSVIFLGGYGAFSYCDPGPASGWVQSIGLNGKRNWTGNIYGNLPGLIIWLINYVQLNSYSPGILGFTGIQYANQEDEHFYLGSALWVKIE